jgi:hypothetical protein
VSVAGGELGDIVGIALGEEQCHTACSEVVAVAGLTFGVEVREHGADEWITADSFGNVPATRAQCLTFCSTARAGSATGLRAAVPRGVVGFRG